MKICYLTYDLDPKAGWGRFSSDLIYGIKRAGCEVLILKERDDGVEGIPILKRRLGIISSAARIRKHLKNCDVIHALDGYPYGVMAVLANLGLGKKLIISGIGSFSVAPLSNWKTTKLLKLAYKKANFIACISHYTKNEILKKIKLNNIEVINPGINFKKFYRPPVPSFKEQENFILSVGALKYRKGYHISIPAFKNVLWKFPDFKYYIVGNQDGGKYFTYLKKIITELNLQEKVIFIDGITDEELINLYQKAKVFVLTPISEASYFEGFGLVYLEANACGLPAVGTKDCGAEDAIKDNETGFLVPQKDREATSQAIIKLLGNQELWQKFSKNGIQWAESHDWSKITPKYLEIYKK